MHQRLRVILGSALAGVLVLSHAPAVSAAGYLKLGDIKGESTAKGHEGEIEVLSWSFGESRPSTMTSASTGRSATAAGQASAVRQPAGKRQHETITFTKRVDKASPLLQQASDSGQMFTNVTLQVPAPDKGKGAYQTMELYNVKVTSYSVSGSSLDDGSIPTETLSLNFDKITWKYWPADTSTNR